MWPEMNRSVLTANKVSNLFRIIITEIFTQTLHELLYILLPKIRNLTKKVHLLTKGLKILRKHLTGTQIFSGLIIIDIIESIDTGKLIRKRNTLECRNIRIGISQRNEQNNIRRLSLQLNLSSITRRLTQGTGRTLTTRHNQLLTSVRVNNGLRVQTSERCSFRLHMDKTKTYENYLTESGNNMKEPLGATVSLSTATTVTLLPEKLQ